ncbi:hypothetical protein Tco_0911962 [Tanacetum coccineum]
MDRKKAQRIALDDALVAPANHLKIGKYNHRLSSTLKSNEPTLQVVLDVLKLSPFYKAFQITANVPEIYMQEFWATVSIHHNSLCFKMNNKSHTLNLENLRDMLQICPKLPAYKEYYAVASGAEPPKAKTKYKKKVDEPVTPSKSKTAPASKGSRLKSPAKVAKTAKKKQPATMPKTKGLAILSEVALTEAEQIKLATKKSKTQFHSSHTSGSSDGVDTQSKVPNEKQQKVSGINEGAGVIPKVPDVPKYDSESDEESWTFSQDEEDVDEETCVNDDKDETESDNDGDDLTHPNLSTYKTDDKDEEQEKADDEEMSSYQRVSTPPEYELTEEENKEAGDMDKDGEQDQDDEDDLYRDVKTLTVVPQIVQQQSSSVSLDLVSKFINPSPNTGIDSILNPNIHSHTLINVPASVTAETPSSDTTIPPPPSPIIQPDSTTTTTIPTMTFPDIPNFASLF